jgi:LCP family protein required for cell wall assembly
MARRTVYIDGEKYLRRTDVETFLIMGLDRFGDTDEDGRAQADFILLAVFDKQSKSYRLLQINRDTMTMVDRYNNSGQYVDSQEMQIALSYAYGELESMSSIKKCDNTVRAIEKLMRGVKVDHYLSITMDGMEKLIDQIGGVDLTVRDDLSSVDERLVKGESVHMDGALALKYVRARRGLNDASNIARMERQKDLMEALVAGLSSDGKKDTDFVGILRKVEDHTTTKCDDVCLGMLENFFDTYTYLGVSALPGEAVKGEVYMEFYVDDNGLEEILKNVFLEKSE